MKHLHTLLRTASISIPFTLCSCNKTTRYNIGENLEKQIATSSYSREDILQRLTQESGAFQRLIQERPYINGSDETPNNMEALIEQMQKISEQSHEHKPATKTGSDYIDIICNICCDTKMYKSEIYDALFPIFIKTLQNLLKTIQKEEPIPIQEDRDKELQRLIQENRELRELTQAMHVQEINGSGKRPNNMEALIEQMQQMCKQSYEYKPATETRRDYIDFMCQIYRGTKMYKSEIYKALSPIFIKTLQSLLKEGTPGNQVLSEVGLNALDIALLNNNANRIEQIIEENYKEDKNTMLPYQLAKKYRMLEIATDIHTAQGEPLITHLTLPSLDISGKPLPLERLSYYTGHQIHKSNRNCNNKNKLVYIENDGHSGSFPTSDYNFAAYNYTKLVELFDGSIIMGDGVTLLTPQDYENMIKELEKLRTENLNFVMICIHTHDSLEGKLLAPIIDKLPDGLAKETLYIISACHSGQYHQNWGNKNAVLITTCDEDEDSITTILSTNVLSDIFQDKTPSTVHFAKLYDRTTIGSTPYISGKWQGETIHKTTVSTYLKTLDNNQSLS